MWRSLIEELAAGRSLRIRLARGDRLVSYGEVLEALAEHVSFRGYFVDLLAELSYPAYFWETPPLTAATLGRCCEFVVIDFAGRCGCDGASGRGDSGSVLEL